VVAGAGDLPPRAEAAGFGRAAQKTAHATKTTERRIGCGGPQPSGFGVLLGGSLNSRSYAFQACSFNHSDISPWVESIF